MLESLSMVKNFFLHKSSFVDENCKIGKNTKIWHFSHIMKNCEIGQKGIIGQNVMIGLNVKIGNFCKIQNNVSIYDGVLIEDHVFCGPSCVFTNVLSPRAEIERKNEFLKTIVKKGASIGANATVICGNNIGSYSMIGAGSVITKDISNFSLVVGNPAKRIGWVSRSGEKLNSNLICPKTGEVYNEENGILTIKN